jgi:enoyl-CoA hydratase/carnithine racemase
MCDIRIASETATFSESFIKVGIVPGDGGAWLLPRVIGLSKALEMSFTGDVISAADALRCGLVSQTVPAEELIDNAQRLAARIATNPGPALRLTKRLLREGQQNTLDSVLELSASAQALAHKTPEHREAVTAFIEKRAPNFHGPR